MAELNVSKKSILSLLTEMQTKKFIIPDYQRPYKWDREKCDILWQDVTRFYEENQSRESEYYLGTIVTCKRSEEDPSSKDVEVIDGQQRITSLLLLLRAFYSKLENTPLQDKDILGLKNKIGPCIWDVDPISGEVSDKSRIHIESRVATESDNETFHEILRTGVTDSQKKDLYSQNYEFFFSQCDEYARVNPMNWKPFCVALLTRCIILPIECEQFDTALTIFSTLNDRGMPLSDSDIFKAQIYRSKNSREEKLQFTQDWKELTETVEDANMKLDDLFRYYSHVIRARNEDKTKEIGLRKFYAGDDNRFERLKNPHLMDELCDLAEFWFAVAKRNAQVDSKTITDVALKRLHCLEHYSNEYWKYATSVFYFTRRDSPNFAEEFAEFLATLIAYLFSQFVMSPTVNAIKDPVYQLCIDLTKGNTLTTSVALTNDFRARLSEASAGKIARGFILLHAYLNPHQNTLLQSNFEIEHIFPRKWQSTNYFGWTQEAAAAFLERFGNKVAIEKKLNILAGNGYFGRKKKEYRSSAVAEVRDLAQYPKDDWAKTDIEGREEKFLDGILDFLTAHLPSATST